MFKNRVFSFIAAVCCLVSSTVCLIADNQIVIPREDVNVSSPTQLQAIVVDPNGNVTEQECTYDPQTQVVVVDSQNSGENASVFFPLLSMGFLWWDGYWVDRDGYYYNNNRWVRVNDDHWDNHWNNYWNKNWDGHWHNYWNNRSNNSNFRYRNQEHWNHDSMRSAHRGDGNRGDRGDRGGHGGGGGGPRHGGSRGGGGHR